MSVDYKDLFEQCGLDEEWQAENKERIEKFLDRIEVRTEEDMAHVMEHFGQQYDTSMKGVRMMLAVVMKETIDWILAGEERDIIIQYSRPTMGILSQGMHVAERRLNEEAGYTKYYSRGTSILMVQVCLGTIFDKTNELIESARTWARLQAVAIAPSTRFGKAAWSVAGSRSRPSRCRAASSATRHPRPRLCLPTSSVIPSSTPTCRRIISGAPGRASSRMARRS